jgi:hypothetical protein
VPYRKAVKIDMSRPATGAHIATRLAQTFGMRGIFSAGPISRLVLPTPAGIMHGVFRKTN